MGHIERIRLPATLSEPLSHYTDAVICGNTLYISGMIATDQVGKIVGRGNVVEQTAQVLRNIRSVLGYAGAAFEDVVKVVVYLRDINDREAINAVRQQFFGEFRPASTLVEISALAHPDALIEIETVANLGRG